MGVLGYYLTRIDATTRRHATFGALFVPASFNFASLYGAYHVYSLTFMILVHWGSTNVTKEVVTSTVFHPTPHCLTPIKLPPPPAASPSRPPRFTLPPPPRRRPQHPPASLHANCCDMLYMRTRWKVLMVAIPPAPSTSHQGLTLGHFRAQLEDLREHIARVGAQLEHLRDTSKG